MGRKERMSMMATTLGMLAAQGIGDGWLRPASAKEPKQFTAFDQERLDKAQAKRERKQAKRNASNAKGGE